MALGAGRSAECQDDEVGVVGVLEYLVGEVHDAEAGAVGGGVRGGAVEHEVVLGTAADHGGDDAVFAVDGRGGAADDGPVQAAAAPPARAPDRQAGHGAGLAPPPGSQEVDVSTAELGMAPRLDRVPQRVGA